MESNLLVSVIIPVFNVRPYLNEALDSVINQTYKNLEIIIIDDGSTDGSGVICDEYEKKDRRVRVVHQENQGLSFARNVGLDILTGDVIAFLDPDDKYLPDYISSMLIAMHQNNSDIVVCKSTIKKTVGVMSLSTKEKARPYISEGLYDSKSSLRALAEGLINPNVWNKVYKAELWHDIRFPVGHVYEDIDTTYKVLNRCNKLCVMNTILYIRRLRPESITSILSSNNRYDFVLALSHFESFIKENTPGVFYTEHYENISRIKLFQMIICYFYSERDECDEEKKELREQIIALKKDVGIRKADLRIKTAYYLIRFCPCLLRIAYPVYHRIRAIQRKVVSTVQLRR